MSLTNLQGSLTNHKKTELKPLSKSNLNKQSLGQMSQLSLGKTSVGSLEVVKGHSDQLSIFNQFRSIVQSSNEKIEMELAKSRKLRIDLEQEKIAKRKKQREHLKEQKKGDNSSINRSESSNLFFEGIKKAESNVIPDSNQSVFLTNKEVGSNTKNEKSKVNPSPYSNSNVVTNQNLTEKDHEKTITNPNQTHNENEINLPMILNKNDSNSEINFIISSMDFHKAKNEQAEENPKNEDPNITNVLLQTRNQSVTTKGANKHRIKDFRVIYDPLWYSKNGMLDYKIPKYLAADLDFQTNSINDEIKVILENIQHYKSTYMNHPLLMPTFKSLERKHQIKLNILLEQSYSIMLEVAKKILIDFSHYLEKFVSVQPPHPDNFVRKVVKVESNAFLNNIVVFNETAGFFKSCFEVYRTLVKQVDDMIIPYNEFIEVKQFLAKIRMNLSNLVFSSKNYIQNFTQDKKLFDKFMLNRRDEEDEMSDRSHDSEKKKVVRVDIIEKLRSQFQFKLNETNERKRRLNNVLNKKEVNMDDSFEKKKRKMGRKLMKNGGLNSKIIDKLLKYCPKEVKFQIVSERIMDRFKTRGYCEDDD